MENPPKFILVTYVIYKKICLHYIFYLNRSGCQWDMLPHDLPAKSTVYDHFARWKADGTWQSILWLSSENVGHEIKVVGRPAGSVRFAEQPRRYVVERTFARSGRYRRHGRDYERYSGSSEAMIKISSIHRMLRLLKKDESMKAIPSQYRESRAKVAG